MSDIGIFSSSLFCPNQFFFLHFAGSYYLVRLRIAILSAIGIFFSTGKFEAHILVAIIAAILGIGYLFYGISIRKGIHAFSGIGWWIGSAMLVTQSKPEDLALFAFLIILLTILPLVIEMRRQRIGFF